MPWRLQLMFRQDFYRKQNLCRGKQDGELPDHEHLVRKWDGFLKGWLEECDQNKKWWVFWLLGDKHWEGQLTNHFDKSFSTTLHGPLCSFNPVHKFLGYKWCHWMSTWQVDRLIRGPSIHQEWPFLLHHWWVPSSTRQFCDQGLYVEIRFQIGVKFNDKKLIPSLFLVKAHNYLVSWVRTSRHFKTRSLHCLSYLIYWQRVDEADNSRRQSTMDSNSNIRRVWSSNIYLPPTSNCMSLWHTCSYYGSDYCPDPH